MDKKIVKNVYFGLVKMITQELRTKRKCILPELGEFSLKDYRPKRISDVNTGERRIIFPKMVIKFTANSNWKKYFKRLLDSDE